MATIHALYLEDDDIDYKRFWPVLTEAWKRNPTLQSLGDIEITWVQTLDEAVAALDGETKAPQGWRFAIFFADLLLPRDPAKPKGEKVADGLKAVEHCRNHYPTVAIVGISIAANRPGGEGERIKDAFFSLGGHEYISKYFVDHEPDKTLVYSKVGEAIESAFRKSGQTNKVAPHPYTNIDMDLSEADLVLAVQIQLIGDETLKLLARQLVPQCADLKVAHVRPGMSGAATFELYCYSRKPFSGEERHLLLKVSKDRDALETELSRAPDPGLFRHDFTATARGGIASTDGWHAIAYAFLENSCTFGDWLIRVHPQKDTIGRFLSTLFGEMAKLHGEYLSQDYLTLVDKVLPSRPIIQRAACSVQELWPVIQFHAPAELSDRAILERFLMKGDIGQRAKSTMPTHMMLCKCHGDLHSRNVLVDLSSQSPMVVDFADSEMMHMASDFAELAADLLVSVWDHGISSYDPSNLKAWRLALRSWLSSKDDRTQTPENTAVRESLDWIHENVGPLTENIVGSGVREWEFQLSLVGEFVKLAGQMALPAPKRAFAIVSAIDILKMVEATIPKRP